MDYAAASAHRRYAAWLMIGGVLPEALSEKGVPAEFFEDWVHEVDLLLKHQPGR